MRRLSIAFLCFFCSIAARADAQPLVQGLDHIPIAVRDLERAGADFAALGFALKPGRPHDNGLRNLHAKFPDGTEIELITASRAADPLSSFYVDWLKAGDGPALLGLYAPDFDAIARRLRDMGIGFARRRDLIGFNDPSLRHVFFARRQKAPSDRPEHFAHANTAFGLRGLWLAGDLATPVLRDLPAGERTLRSPCAPFGSGLSTLRLPEGEIVLLPPAGGRSIVAATLVVGSLEAVRRLIPTAVTGCASDSLWVETHGLWLEFRQP